MTAPAGDPALVAAGALRAWTAHALERAGVAATDAGRVADCLVQTSLWGIDSHGVSRLPHYLDRIELGSINPRARPVFTRSGPGTGSVDGDHALGFVAVSLAMDHAIMLAREAGVGVVGVSNSSHCGAIGLYTRKATAAGMVGIGFTHSDSFVTPHGGDHAFFGTNPISIAVPTGDPARPLCVDMATSIVPWNIIMNARMAGQPVAPGLGVDAAGAESTDPEQIVAVRPAAGHKGYALAFAIDMLCGPLNGMNYGPHLTRMYTELDQPRRLGSLMIALDPARFAGAATLAPAVAAAIREVKAQREGILAPGDPEYRSAEARGRDGIPMDAPLRAELRHWAAKLGVEPPPFIDAD